MKARDVIRTIAVCVMGLVGFGLALIIYVGYLLSQDEALAEETGRYD